MGRSSSYLGSDARMVVLFCGDWMGCREGTNFGMLFDPVVNLASRPLLYSVFGYSVSILLAAGYDYSLLCKVFKRSESFLRNISTDVLRLTADASWFVMRDTALSKISEEDYE